MSIKVLDVRWFCSASNIGIVRCDLGPLDGIVYYVGSCSGMNEQVDIEYIAAWGSTFPTNAGDLLFGINNDKST